MVMEAIEMKEGEKLILNGVNYQVRKVICNIAILLNLDSEYLQLEQIKIFK